MKFVRNLARLEGPIWLSQNEGRLAELNYKFDFDWEISRQYFKLQGQFDETLLDVKNRRWSGPINAMCLIMHYCR